MKVITITLKFHGDPVHENASVLKYYNLDNPVKSHVTQVWSLGMVLMQDSRPVAYSSLYLQMQRMLAAQTKCWHCSGLHKIMSL